MLPKAEPEATRTPPTPLAGGVLAFWIPTSNRRSWLGSPWRKGLEARDIDEGSGRRGPSGSRCDIARRTKKCSDESRRIAKPRSGPNASCGTRPRGPPSDGKPSRSWGGSVLQVARRGGALACELATDRVVAMDFRRGGLEVDEKSTRERGSPLSSRTGTRAREGRRALKE